MKKTKRFLIGLLCALSACMGAFAFAGCEEEHVHSYTDEVTAPTCTEKGYTTHTCACGDVRVDTYVDALGHDYKENEKKLISEPTCDKEGFALLCCADCGETTVRVLSKSDTHIFEDGVCKFCEKPQSQGLVYTIKNGVCAVTGIGDCTDSHIYIPKAYNGFPVSVVAIENLRNVEQVTDITLPQTITDPFDGVTVGLPNLQNIYVSNENENLASQNGVLYSKDMKTLIKYPEGRTGEATLANVEQIEYRAFSGCDGLTSITIPNSVTLIEKHAFLDCSSLTNVTIGSGVTLIECAAFYGCSSLVNVTFEDTSRWFSTTSRSDWQNKNGGEEKDVTSPFVNPQYFKEDIDYYWYKL